MLDDHRRRILRQLHSRTLPGHLVCLYNQHDSASQIALLILLTPTAAYQFPSYPGRAHSHGNNNAIIQCFLCEKARSVRSKLADPTMSLTCRCSPHDNGHQRCKLLRFSHLTKTDTDGLSGPRGYRRYRRANHDRRTSAQDPRRHHWQGRVY